MKRLAHWSIAAALAGTLGLGLWLRTVLAGWSTLPLDFGYVRHGHSHLGYFGVLFPLAWIGWRQAGHRLPGRAILGLYGAATIASLIGFLTAGYGVLAIVGCTVVGVLWVVTAWPLRHAMGRLDEALGGVLPGVVLGLACVPPIAMNLRKHPEVAHGFVATFLAGLLLMVIVPSALAARRRSAGPWPLLLLSGALAAAALGVWPTLPARVGMLAFAGCLAWAARGGMPLHLRLVWWAVSAGLAAMALGLLPNTRPVALGAIHFLVLGPILASLAPKVLRHNPPASVWCVSHGAAALMSGALVAQGLDAGPWTWQLTAYGGSLTVLWWSLVGLLQWVPVERAGTAKGC